MGWLSALSKISQTFRMDRTVFGGVHARACLSTMLARRFVLSFPSEMERPRALKSAAIGEKVIEQNLLEAASETLTGTSARRGDFTAFSFGDISFTAHTAPSFYVLHPRYLGNYPAEASTGSKRGHVNQTPSIWHWQRL